MVSDFDIDHRCTSIFLSVNLIDGQLIVTDTLTMLAKIYLDCQSMKIFGIKHPNSMCTDYAYNSVLKDFCYLVKAIDSIK